MNFPYESKESLGRCCLSSHIFFARTAEVRDLRRAGVLGNLTNYTAVTSVLPSDLRLWFKLVEVEPPGYDASLYGPWPGPCWILKTRYAPSFKSALSDANWHTVSVIVTRGHNPNNVLRLGPILSRIFATLCDCLSGVKTNSCCSHIIALVKSVMAAALFRPSKVFESRITDIYR